MVLDSPTVVLVKNLSSKKQGGSRLNKTTFNLMFIKPWCMVHRSDNRPHLQFSSSMCPCESTPGPRSCEVFPVWGVMQPYRITLKRKDRSPFQTTGILVFLDPTSHARVRECPPALTVRHMSSTWVRWTLIQHPNPYLHDLLNDVLREVDPQREEPVANLLLGQMTAAGNGHATTKHARALNNHA